jgi:hypothetical protein
MSPLAGISGSLAAHTVDTGGTVRSRASIPSASLPWAISWARARVAPLRL